MPRSVVRRLGGAGGAWWLLAAVAACSGGGGGGGGGGGPGGPSVTDPTAFDTPEYRANHGLGGIDAASAYARGATGRGVTVAVVDTGIDVDHPEFAGTLHPRATDIVTGNPAFLDDVGGHGTAVAGVIAARRNGRGTHGVAYAATLLPIRADVPGSCATGCSFTQGAVADATAYAVASGARVINYSLGGAASIGATLRDALADAAARDVVLVLSAGNEAGASPGYPGRFAAEPGAGGAAIVVGAVDAANRIASFSNRAGAARDAFLVAPGTDIRSTAAGGGEARVDGTSFSAPHVAGAAAVVLDAAPHLSADEVVELLLNTATDLGASGTDAVYGRGLVDLDTALSPQGALAVPAGTRADGPAAALAGTRLRAGGAFGAALGRAPGLGDAILLDGYGRAYRVDLSRRVAPAAPAVDLAGWLAPGAAVRSAAVGPGGALGLALVEAEDGPRPAAEDGGPWGRDGGGRAVVGFTATGRLDGTTRLTLARGAGLGAAFGPAAGAGAGGAAAFGGLLGRGALGAPFAAFLDGGDALTLERELAAGFGVRLAVASSSGRASALARPSVGNGGRTAYLAEVSHRAAGGAELRLHVGELRERGSLLDAAGDGALALGGARTRFVGLGGRLPVAPRVELLAQLAVGRTEPEGGAGGVVRDVSTLHSAAFGAGLGFRRVVRPGDRLAVVVSRPLKVVAGRATVDVPVARTVDGRVVRRATRADLVPAGDEIDLELRYGTALGPGGTLDVGLLARFEPGHEAGAAPEVVAGVRYGLRF